MTLKASKQLEIMRQRVQRNQVIKDCYKQVYLYSSRHKNFAAINVACLHVIRKVFVKEVINNQSNLMINDLIMQLERQCGHVKWFLCIQKKEINSVHLFKQIKKLIDDDRFKTLLNQQWHHVKEKDPNSHLQLEREIYFTLNILDQLEQSHLFRESLVLLDEDKLYLGLSTTKNDILTTLKKLDLANDKNCHLRLTHISQPLNFRGFIFKYQRKTNRLMIEVPQHMLIKLSHMFQYGDFHNNRPKARGTLIHKSVKEIAFIYHQELRQIASEYRVVDNPKSLKTLFYFAHLSLIKTIARKYSCTMAHAKKILDEHNITHYIL